MPELHKNCSFSTILLSTCYYGHFLVRFNDLMLAMICEYDNNRVSLILAISIFLLDSPVIPDFRSYIASPRRRTSTSSRDYVHVGNTYQLRRAFLLWILNFRYWQIDKEKKDFNRFSWVFCTNDSHKSNTICLSSKT